MSTETNLVTHAAVVAAIALAYYELTLNKQAAATATAAGLALVALEYYKSQQFANLTPLTQAEGFLPGIHLPSSESVVMMEPSVSPIPFDISKFKAITPSPTTVTVSPGYPDTPRPLEVPTPAPALTPSQASSFGPPSQNTVPHAVQTASTITSSGSSSLVASGSKTSSSFGPAAQGAKVSFTKLSGVHLNGDFGRRL